MKNLINFIKNRFNHTAIALRNRRAEGYVDTGMDDMMEEPVDESSTPGWLIWVIIGVVVLVVVIVIIVIVSRKKKKNKAAEPSIDFDWSAPQEVNSHEDQ